MNSLSTYSKPGLVAYFAILLLLAANNLLSFDTYYYWDWSRHLALSYYDGSPMIAYWIKFATIVLGDNLFALSIIGWLSLAVTGFIVYKTARLFLAQAASYVATLLWIFSPLTTLDLLKQTTYDTPLTVFWALTVYLVVKYISTNKNNILYLIGASIGCLLLSKYSGIVLVVSLLIFILFTEYRSLFKSKYFYLAMLIAVCIFSPVIWWNYQHNWQSFLYQLNTHNVQANKSLPWMQVLLSFIYVFVPALNYMLLVPLASLRTQKPAVRLLQIITIVFLIWYVCTAGFAIIRPYWLTQYLLTAALLGGVVFQNLAALRKSLLVLIGVYAVVSLGIMFNNSLYINLTMPKKKIYYNLMQQWNADSALDLQQVVTSGWMTARMLFFLKSHPQIYTLDCGEAQNQYGLWSKSFQEEIAHKNLHEITYIDLLDRKFCLQKYFNNCQRLPTKSIMSNNQLYELFAYRCSNA